MAVVMVADTAAAGAADASDGPWRSFWDKHRPLLRLTAWMSTISIEVGASSPISILSTWKKL